MLISRVQATTHLESVEAAVRLEHEVLRVLQGVNVAVLDNEVAQVLCLWGEAVEAWKLRAGAEGRSSLPGPHTQHPKLQKRCLHPTSTSIKEGGNAVPGLGCGRVSAGECANKEDPPANILYETILSPQLDSGCFTQEGLVCSIKMSISQRPRLSLQAVSTLRRFSRAAHTAILGNPVPDELSPRLEIQSRWTSHCRTSLPAKQKYQAVVRAS